MSIELRRSIAISYRLKICGGSRRGASGPNTLPSDIADSATSSTLPIDEVAHLVGAASNDDAASEAIPSKETGLRSAVGVCECQRSPTSYWSLEVEVKHLGPR